MIGHRLNALFGCLTKEVTQIRLDEWSGHCQAFANQLLVVFEPGDDLINAQLLLLSHHLLNI